MEKPCYKEKLRLRSYGTPKETDLVYVELKKKFDGIVYKRRVPMRYKEAKKYLYNGIRPNMDSQILREIDYTLDFYQARPAVYLAYDRLAFYGKDNPDFRITFDMNIRARQHVLELDKGVYGTLLMPWESSMEYGTAEGFPACTEYFLGNRPEWMLAEGNRPIPEGQRILPVFYLPDKTEGKQSRFMALWTVAQDRGEKGNNTYGSRPELFFGPGGPGFIRYVLFADPGGRKKGQAV